MWLTRASPVAAGFGGGVPEPPPSPPPQPASKRMPRKRRCAERFADPPLEMSLEKFTKETLCKQRMCPYDRRFRSIGSSIFESFFKTRRLHLTVPCFVTKIISRLPTRSSANCAAGDAHTTLASPCRTSHLNSPLSPNRWPPRFPATSAPASNICAFWRADGKPRCTSSS